MTARFGLCRKKRTNPQRAAETERAASLRLSASDAFCFLLRKHTHTRKQHFLVLDRSFKAVDNNHLLSTALLPPSAYDT